MLRLLFAVLRSRILWIAIGVTTAAGVAFVFTVAVTAAVVIAVRGQDVDPDVFAELAASQGMAAAAAVLAGVVVAWQSTRRARARRWLPLYQAMVRDAASAPDIHLAEMITPPDPAAGGHMLVADRHTGTHGPLWLPGLTLPRGTVVCFTRTTTGPQMQAWMSRRLRRACAREAARIERRTANADHERHAVAENHIRQLASETVAAVELLLREHGRALRSRAFRCCGAGRRVLVADSYRSRLRSG